MELVPWKPFGAVGALRKEMEDLWDKFFSGRLWPTMPGEEWFPWADVSETKDNLVVKLELPGVDPKDVTVSVTDDLLSIKGEKKQKKEEHDERSHSVERYYGAFQRSFRLPRGVRTEKIEASFDKGVLKIVVPKSEEAKKKEIEIKVT